MEKITLLPDDLDYIETTNDVGQPIKHSMETNMIQAINAALAINRPLLIWGEPGMGKSQLAKAVAKELKRVFLSICVDAKTESRDLLFHFDAVARLAQAQLCAVLKADISVMAMENFIIPKQLWWALDWRSAAEQVNDCKDKIPPVSQGCCSENGVVLLIDEIDKADSDVPNGLLEALGSSCIHPEGLLTAITPNGKKPLVIITTNNERSLPDAFVRRCLSLHLLFPEEQPEEFLVKRARLNFSTLNEKEVLLPAAQLLLEDRTYAKKHNFYPLPGQAEYFDLLRGVVVLNEQTGIAPKEVITQLREYTYRKHSGFHQ